MSLSPGDVVIHPEFGQGKVIRIFGSIAVVDFFGDEIEVPISTLTIVKSAALQVVDHSEDDHSQDRIAFRKAFEAINLGVVPPDPSQLIALTIRSSELKEKVSEWLAKAPTEGLCKVAFGYYGAGKSHMLKFVRCMAIEAGWAVAYLEFDPKAADPAKPHLVYQNLMSALEFPPP